MDLSAILTNTVLLLLITLMIFAILQRALGRRANPARKKRLRLAGAFIGNALMPLHAIIHPHTKHLIVEQIKEDDQDADPIDSRQYLQRQLKKIRNGEDLDHITTRLQ